MKTSNKILTAVLAILVSITSLSFAQMERHGGGIFGATGLTACTNVIGPVAGHVAIVSLSYSWGTDGGTVTYKRMPASQVTRCITDVNSSTNVPVVVDSSGAIFGSAIAATDWVIVSDNSTNAAGKQLRDIGALDAISTNTDGTVYRNLQMAAAVTSSCDSNGVVYIIKGGDIVSRTVTAAANDALYQGLGNLNMPFAILISSTNNPQDSGYFEVWE